MTKLFPVVQLQSQTAERVELQLTISADIVYFEGHFPQAPVLAGVTQLHWVVEYCKQYFAGLSQVMAVEVLKFQVMIRPDDVLQLVLERTADKTTQFSYYKAEQKVASGRLKWNANQHD